MSKLRDFEILHRIGAGSFGTVFSARRKKTGKMYVMKKIQLEGTTREEKSSAVKEVKLLASLRSKYVVQYFDSFSENDVLYLVMEWCRKGDLQQYLRKQKKPLPEDEIINIVSQITRGMCVCCVLILWLFLSLYISLSLVTTLNSSFQQQV
jgi:NIMA (never in mitosis gene a)-related kinase 1/4/5